MNNIPVASLPDRSAEDWRYICKNIEAGYMSDNTGKFYESSLELYRRLKPFELWCPGERMLDLGCGNGRLPIGIAAQERAQLMTRDSIGYIGLDAFSRSIAFCNSVFAEYPMFTFRWLPVINTHILGPADHLHGVDLKGADAIKLPYPDSYFDSCVCIGLFIHLGTDAAAANYVREISRVVKRGGRILTTWYKSPPREISGREAHTVYPESLIRFLITGKMEIIKDWGGARVNAGDEWYILARNGIDDRQNGNGSRI